MNDFSAFIFDIFMIDREFTRTRDRSRRVVWDYHIDIAIDRELVRTRELAIDRVVLSGIFMSSQCARGHAHAQVNTMYMYHDCMKNRWDMRCDKLCDGGNPCRRLSQAVATAHCKS